MTGKISPEWVEAGTLAIHNLAPPRDPLYSHRELGTMEECVEAALAAVLPLVVRDMMEPGREMIAAALKPEGYSDVQPNLKMGGLPVSYVDAAFRAMLRAWARERGLKLDSI